MRKMLLLLLAWTLPTAALPPAAPEGEALRFRTVDVFIDSDEYPLAAWQIEITSSDPGARIVGVEGGEAKHFAAAPYYDPAALQGGRIIIAAFTTEDGPPVGRVRVARVHMTESGTALEPAYSARLMAAARQGGDRIEASVELIGK
jgi:hypothetical protein